MLIRRRRHRSHRLASRRANPRGEHLEKRLPLTVSTEDGLDLTGRVEDLGHPQSITCGCPGCAAPPLDMFEVRALEAPPEAIFPLDQTFLLHSRPSATKTIYLDFDGHTTSGTAWQSGATFVTPAYTVDSSPGFSNTELLNIQNIWARTVEAFSPFDVNVTTEEPALDDLRKTGGSDTRWGIRVVIGGDGAWLPGAGGVAYVGSFNWSSDTPTFVFPDRLSRNNKSIADAVNHEVGHTVGLRHDGRTSPSEGYYTGHGSGATGWAPIMGVGYFRELVQWSKGEYLNANNPEDDLAIITSQNGFGYRADDHGNTPATATQYVGADLSGVIERNTDVDVITFYTSRRAVIDVQPWQYGATLDILAELIDSAGGVVQTSNPANGLGASFNATVTAGVYYLRIQGTGKGDPKGTGYTDYGSLGQYTVSLVVDANPTVESLVDRIGTIQGAVADGGRTNDPQPLVSGTGAPGSTITLTAGALTLGTAAVAADGTWSVQIAPPLADGTYQLFVGDSFGGVSEEAFTFTVDTIAPPAPVLVSAFDNVGLIQGPITNGGRTDDTELQLSGTAAAGSLVTVFRNGTAIGTTTADPAGNWALVTPPLGSGSHDFTAIAGDAVGNESNPSAPPFRVTVDTSQPSAPVITGVFDEAQPGTGIVPNGGMTNDPTPRIAGTGDPGSIVRVRSGPSLIAQTTVGGTGAWEIVPPTPLTDGTYTLTAVATNDIGAESSPSAAVSFTVDTVAPSVTITRSGSGPLGIGMTSLVTVTVSEPGTAFSTAVVTSTGGTLSGWSGTGTSFSATFTPTPGFAGTASIVVPQGAFTDAVGYGTSGASLSIPVDTAAPTVTLSRSGPPILTVGDTAAVTFSLSEPAADFVESDIAVTGGDLVGFAGFGTTYTATFIPAVSFRGTATIAVLAGRFTDATGNGNLPASPLMIPVNTVAPTLAIARLGSGSLAIGDSDTIAFTLSAPSPDFTVADLTVVGGSITQFSGSGISFSATFVPTSGFQGTAVITVAAGSFTDPSGNANETASITLPVDTRRPTITITRAGFGALTIGATAVVSFTASEPVVGLIAGDVIVSGGSLSGFSGSGASYSAVFTPRPSFTGLATISVAGGTFLDAVGNANTTGGSVTIPIDTVAPTVRVSRSGTGTLKIGDTTRVTFTVSESTRSFTLADVTVTGGTLSGFSGSGTTYTAVFAPASSFRGAASIRVLANVLTDLAGNSNQPSGPLFVDVDTVPPRVLGFRASLATAALGIGDSITIIADLSEPVAPTGGTFTVLLNSGGRVVLAVDPGGRTARGVYTAQPGEVSSDLEVTAIIPNGSVRDLPGNLLTAAIPAPAMSLAGRHDIAVDAAVKFVGRGAFSVDPTAVPDAGNQYRRVPLRFTTPVTGVMLSRLIVSLDGKPISLRGAALNGRGANYELLLPVSRGNPAGLYAVALRPGGGVRAVANGAPAETQTALHWGYRRSLGMVPDAPTSIAPRAVSQSGQRTVVTLGWSAPRGNGGGVVTGYEAQYRATGDGAWLAVRGPIAASGSPTATVSGMSLGREYEFRVAARNAAGLGAFAVSRPFVIKVGAGDDLSPPTLTPIEANGTVTLARDSTGRLYANGQAIRFGGAHVRQDPSPTAIWRFLAADIQNGVNTLVLQHSSGSLRLWRMTTSWDQQAGEGWYAPGSDAYRANEVLFDTDFDNDGVVGSTIIESTGAITLSYDTDLNLRANGTLVTFGGSPVKHDPSSTAVWKFLAADVDRGSNTMILQNSSGHLRLWRMTASWAQQAGEGWYAPGSPGYRAVEVAFGMDFNRDGKVGH